MLEIQWKLIIISAALYAVASAQQQTIDDIFIVQTDNISSHDEGIIEKHDDIKHDNSSFNSTNTYELSLTGPEREANSDENNINVAVPNLSDAKPVSGPETKETSESRLHDTTETTNESIESSMTGEPSKSQESPEKLLSSESGSQGSLQTRSSQSTGEMPESKEPESNQQPGTGEVASPENPDAEENPDAQPPAVSGEDASGQNSEVDGVEEDVVQTTHGPVKGYHWPANEEILAFYDIPYGKFNGPFETPITAQSWLDVHEATSHIKTCPQIDNDQYIGDTNCLTLSIFTPKDAENVSVLFHVYDPYANSKSSDPLKYGPDYLVPKGVVLVLPNYRFGAMGFLCMHNETALGNAGLKDLSLALEWVKDNIHLFGGNPANIVVSGEGAAGAYAGYLAICSRSKYYVNKVITESGSALSHWALDRNPTSTAYQLAEKIRTESDGGIYNNTFAEVTLETILKASEGTSFMPCIEYDREPFIDDTPWKILQNKEIDTSFMIGTASLAGTHEATHTTAEFVAQINEHFDILLPEDLVFRNDNERREFALKLRDQYFGDDNITANDLEELALWYTDASYLSPGIRLARPLLAAGATVYMYEFAFVGSLNFELEALHRPVSGAIRGDLMGYLFHKDGTTVEEDSSEKKMIELMVDLWISFINNGKPSAANLEWNELKKAEDDEEEWLLINAESRPKKGVHVDRLRLWTNLYDEHFIENNSGFRYSPYLLSVATAIMFLTANYKLN